MAAAMTTTDDLSRFLALSAVLTGFRKIDLLGTGMARRYYEELCAVVGDLTAAEFLTAASDCLGGTDKDVAAVETGVGNLLKDPRHGPLARNVIKMWYLGNWSQLPPEWRAANGISARDVDHVVSAMAYQEALVWRVAGSHPPGAKQAGFGTWSLPPVFEDD